MLDEPIAVTLKVTNVLEKLGVPYIIGGSLASTLYGMIRTTQDSDIISLPRWDLNMLSRLSCHYKVNSLLMKRKTFELESEISANFASAEDTILSKLEWFRMGGEVSDGQWRDIPGVLKTRAGELDLDYLHKWATELNVSDLLERALKA